MRSWVARFLLTMSLAASITGGVAAWYAFTRQPLPAVEVWAILTFVITMISAGVVVFSSGARARFTQKAHLLSKVYEESIEPIFLVNRKGKAMMVNKAAVDFARKHDPIILDMLSALIVRDDEAGGQKLAKLNDSLLDLLPFEESVTLQLPNGALKRVHLMTTPLPSEGVSILRISATGSSSATETGVSYEMSQIMDQFPVGIYLLDEADRIVYINQTMASWLGTTPASLIAQNIPIKQFIQRKGESEADGTVHYMLKGKDGVRVSVTVNEVTHTAGQTGGLVTRDDLMQEDWQSALRKSKVLFKRFFEEAPIGIVLVDLEGKITDSNRIFQEYVNGDKAGQTLSSCINGADRPKLAAKMAEAISVGDTAEPVEITIGTDNQSVVSVYAGRMEDDQETVFGLMLHLIDVTEQKSLEEQFVQSQKMQAVGQLAGGVAHDFNNLLTAMIGYCDLLMERHRPGDPSFSDINQIKQNSNRAANLVRQLLAFSRQQRLHPTVLNVTDLLSDMQNMLDRLLGENVHFDIDHGRDLWPLVSDHTQVEQVILNLCVNARDAMDANGDLTIKTRNVEIERPYKRGAEVMPAGDYVKIDVADTGSGISPDILERIFEPFFSTKDVGSGTGLGLSTVYGIIKQSKGYIFVDSVVGQGTTFSLYFPRHIPDEKELAAAREKEESDSGEPNDLTGNEVILFAEDEDPVRAFTTRALSNRGYTILGAGTGEGALEKMEEHGGSPDLVISDVMMPGMDGPTFMRAIRDLHPDLPIICISGYSEGATAEKLDHLDNVYFLAKPFSLNAVVHMVRQVLDRAAKPIVYDEVTDGPLEEIAVASTLKGSETDEGTQVSEDDIASDPVIQESEVGDRFDADGPLDIDELGSPEENDLLPPLEEDDETEGADKPDSEDGEDDETGAPEEGSEVESPLPEEEEEAPNEEPETPDVLQPIIEPLEPSESSAPSESSEPSERGPLSIIQPKDDLDNIPQEDEAADEAEETPPVEVVEPAPLEEDMPADIQEEAIPEKPDPVQDTPPEPAEETPEEAPETPEEAPETPAPHSLIQEGEKLPAVILYAEDEAPVRTFTQRALEKKGYTIISGASGEEALAAYKKYGQPVDMLLTDVMMPGMDGPTLIDHMRELQPAIKILVVSGYSEASLRERVSNDKGLKFLPKPFSLKEIVTEVEGILSE